MTITASTNLDKGDVETMVEEAQKHAAKDQERRDLAEARNVADTMAYQAEKALKELGEKVSADDRSQIEGKISELREVLDTEDVQRIKQLTEEVQQASYALSQQLYAQEGAGPQAGEPPTDKGVDDEDVVEGEFREA